MSPNKLSGIRRAIIALTCLCAAWGAPLRGADAAEQDSSAVIRATLDNGMRVVIVRNTLAPVVSTSVNYIVGSDEAPSGFPGMAHAQEHMMFRGGPGLSADQLTNIGGIMGGNFNADTRESVTQFLFTVPAEDIDVALHIEAARMAGISDTDEDWNQERGAIEQEVAQDLSSPTYVLFAKLRARLFAGSPYEHDALGTRESFDRTTGAMLREFYGQWYAPNNAILMIVGNVDLQATLAKVRELFGAIPAKTLPKRPDLTLHPVEPQSMTLDSDLPYGLYVMGMRMPGLDDPDFAASEVLADVLSSHRGELYTLVPQGKALDTGFEPQSLPKAGMGFVTIAFPAGADPKAVERETRALLEKIKQDGVPADLVAAAKLQERRQAEFQKNSIEGLATVWSEAVAIDGLASPDEDLERIDKVTVADVNRVARKYLDLDHSVAAVLTPQGSGKPAPSSSFGGQENIALGDAKPTPLPDWAQTALGRLTVPASTLHPTVTTLPNGITMIVQQEDVSDTVSLYGHIKNRSELEVPQGQEGLSQLLESLFPYGTETLDRLAYQRALDEIGAEEQAGTDFWVETLAQNFERGVELVADNELHPALPQPAFDIVKEQTAQIVAGRIKSPGYLTQRALRTALYPKDDPTLREALPSTVRALTLEDVRAYHRSAFRPDLTVIVVIGKITPEAAKAAVEKYFGAWQASGAKPETDLAKVPPNTSAVTAVPDASRVQDRVILAETIGLTRADPDYYALELGNNVLGGSFDSTRLTRDLRKNAELVYAADSYLDSQKTRGNFYVEFACDPQNVLKATGIVDRELRDLQTTPVSEDELARAKALLLRKIPLDDSSMADIARGLMERWTLGLPLDEPTRAAKHYLDLSPADIQTAFKKWLRLDDFARVSEGPPPQ